MLGIEHLVWNNDDVQIKEINILSLVFYPKKKKKSVKENFAPRT